METRQLPLFDSGLLSKSTQLVDTIPAFQKYLRDEGKTNNTITGFTSDLNLMCEFFGDDMTLGEFTTSDLNRFLHWLENGRGKPCSRKSYARRVTTLKVLFKWLQEKKVRPDDPARAVIQRSGPAPLQPILTRAEIYQLLDFTSSLRVAKKPDPRPDLLVRLLLDTGIKKNETMRLNHQAIDLRGETPLLVVRHTRKANVYKERRIPLDPEWLDVLEEYVHQYQPKTFFFECTPRNLEYVLSDTATAAGIESRVSFEILRWTSAVRDYLNGMELDALREKMGLSQVSWRETSTKIAQLAKKQK